MSDHRLLLVSGSTREGSSNTLVLSKLHELDHVGVVTDLYEGLTSLPPFIPEDEVVPTSVRDLLERVDSADAVLFSAPEYAGSLPGVLKNLLDWTVGEGELYGKAVAWLDVANPGRGGGAQAQLRSVLGYVGADIIESACVRVTLENKATTRVTPGEEGQLLAVLTTVLAALAKDDDRICQGTPRD